MKKKNSALINPFVKMRMLKEPMKTMIVFLFILLISSVIGSSVMAQDLIILRNGDEIKSIVSEVGTDIIKYKKYDNQTGPVYSIEKNKVFMIKYENGSKDVFTEQAEPKPQQQAQTQTQPQTRTQPQPQNSITISSAQPLEARGASVRLNGKILPESQVRGLLATYPAALGSYNSGKSLRGVGDVVGWAGILGGVYYLYKGSKSTTDIERNLMGRQALYLMGVGFVGEIIFNAIGNGKIRSSVSLYNSSINKTTSYRLNFGLQESGVGFALKF